MNRLFKYHAIFTQFLQRPSRIPILAIDARLCLFHPRADEARVPTEQRTGLSECRQSGGAFDHEFTQTPLAKHASFSGISSSRSVLALHLKRLFDNAVRRTTKPRDSALRAVTKEVVGIRVLLTRLLFGDGILRRLLRRVSAVNPTSAALRY